MTKITGALLAILFLAGGRAHGWWGDGHGILTRGAVRSLPAEMPEFFRGGEETIVVFRARERG